MTAPTIPPEVVAAGYAAQQQATRAMIAAYLNALWARLTSWRTPDADRFAAQAAPIVTGGQQRMAALTAAYLEQMVRTNGGTPGRLDLSGLTDADLRGVPATEVYQRPFRQIWTDLSQGKPLDEAVTSAGHRLQSLVATDLQLAKTHTAQRVLSGSDKVIGSRRVLNGDRSCALCVLASTRVYSKSELLPIHPGCDCGVEPLFGDEGPLDASEFVMDAEALHDLVRETFGKKYVNASGRFSNEKADQKSSIYGKTGARDYRNLVVTHDHGEIGPVLALKGQNFTGPPT